MQELTQKETSYLTDAKSHEQLCIDKYNKYSAEAKAPELKSLFSQLAQKEQGHYDTLNQILGGTIPTIDLAKAPPTNITEPVVTQTQADKDADQLLLKDSLEIEKKISSDYNTAIFEFKNTQIRNILNHIQRDEQEHGDELYKYMAANGMYN